MNKIWFGLMMLPFTVSAQKYNISAVPDSLKENANAIKRCEELNILIKGIDRAIIKHKYAITVLNEQGNKYAVYSNDYNKLQDLSDISGTLYDAEGKKLKTVRKKDIADLSVEDGYSLMNDDRMKVHNFYYRQYPYTVEYEDEQELDGIYFLPYWQPVEDEGFAVQESKFFVQTPADYKLRYKVFNYLSAPVAAQNGAGFSYTWEVTNVKAFIYEWNQPPLTEVTPSIFIAPANFSIGGYTGNMSTWLEFGKFQMALNQGRNKLPDNIKQDVHRLTDGIQDTDEKVRVLYDYLQNNTRYISIQLGIGGWQPFDAKYVATNRYGDCKALSNYMISLLNEAGIKANYVVINAGAGRKGFNEDFPAPYFNHVICCVPNGKDTLWLECTSQTDPAGYMGSFTGNRKALLISDDGGHVVNTPSYTANENTQIRVISATIDEAGKLNANVNTHYTGVEQEPVDNMLNYKTKTEQAEILKKEFDLPTYDITDFNYKKFKAKIPAIDEQLKLVADNYASVSGKRLFVKPNILSDDSYKLKIDEDRKFDIVYKFSFRHADTVNIQIPESYFAESIPKDVTLNNKFGNYEIHFKVESNKIFLTRKYERTAGRFSPSEYDELVKFYDDMYKADRSRIVFIKKEG